MQEAAPVTHLLIGQLWMTTSAEAHFPTPVGTLEEYDASPRDVVERKCLSKECDPALGFKKYWSVSL